MPAMGRVSRLLDHITASDCGAVSRPVATLKDSELARLGFVSITSPIALTAAVELAEKGFTVLPDMIDRAWLAQLRERFETLSREEGRLGGLEVLPADGQAELLAGTNPQLASGPNPGIRRLGDLVNKGQPFDKIWQNQLLQTLVAGVLPGPFKLHSLNGHDPLPGHGWQSLHADWGGGDERDRDPSVFGVCNSAWLLDDHTPETGATRLVPKSHLRPGSKPSEGADAEAIQVSAPAGSVVIWNGSTWHGGCLNSSSTQSSRRAVHCAWIDRHFDQQTNQRQYLRPETRKRLSPLHLYLLDAAA